MAELTQLDKLLDIAAQENKLVKHEIEICGHDLSFWQKPLTIAEYQLAKADCKDPDDVLESTARLFIMKALDQAGNRQYQKDALPVLMRVLPVEHATKLMQAMGMKTDDQDLGQVLDMKSVKKGVKETTSSPR